MLIVEQTLTCDICGEVIRELSVSVPPGHAIQQIDRDTQGVRGWKDVCAHCFGHLKKAFWEVKATTEGRK